MEFEILIKLLSTLIEMHVAAVLFSFVKSDLRWIIVGMHRCNDSDCSQARRGKEKFVWWEADAWNLNALMLRVKANKSRRL